MSRSEAKFRTEMNSDVKLSRNGRLNPAMEEIA